MLNLVLHLINCLFLMRIRIDLNMMGGKNCRSYILYMHEIYSELFF